jgi:hypothetical protein
MGMTGEWPHCSINQLLPSDVSGDKVVLDGRTWHGEE